MGMQHHAIVCIDIHKGQPHDFKPMFHGACTTGPERAYMRSLLALLADIARIYGYGQQTVHGGLFENQTSLLSKSPSEACAWEVLFY